MTVKRKKNKGISLRTVQLWLTIGAVIVSGLMFYATYDLSASFRRLTEQSEQQITLRKAARGLMEASDYLTEKAQRFSVQGDMRLLDEYFEEAFETNRREKAVSTMAAVEDIAVPLAELQAAMETSVSLMNREYYAMRLVIEAKGYTDYPEQLRSVKLSDEDQALSPEEKMQLAAEMLHDYGYYRQKDRIRDKMGACLNELERISYNSDESALETLREQMMYLRLSIALFIVAVLFLVWLTAHLGIRPILNAVERIKADRPSPEAGAKEFRYLAQTYNKMYEAYKDSLEHLSFKASHDELTGAYNRSGYELLLSSIDLNTTCMMMFDVDNFKSINDTYGHEVGDKVLVKLVRLLKSNFRADDYICRIGGDEFVVFMEHSNEILHTQIVSKIERINQELNGPNDGLPPITMSVGVVHGTDATDARDLLKKADQTMYQAKQNGKNTYAFYG